MAGARGTRLTGLDQGAFSTSMVIPIINDVYSDSYTAKLDLSKEFGQSFVLSGGVSYADRQIDGNTIATNNVVVLTGQVPGFNPANYVTGTPWATRFPLGFRLNYVDNVKMRHDVEEALKALQAAGRYNPANNVSADTLYHLNEKLAAGYVSGKYEFQGGQVVAGLRVESFRLGNRGTGRLADGTLAPLSASKNDTDFFPSLNARFDLSRDLVLRVATQRGIARPSFGEVRVGSSINDTTTPGSISGGNPDLRPETTWGLDASLEKYLSGKGLLSVAVFNRWVSDVLYSSSRTVGSHAFDSNGVDRSAYRLTSSFNGDGGRLSGIEFGWQQQFAFLPEPFNRLGFQGNQTFVHGKFDTPERKGIAFPGTSKRISNASLYYEHEGLSLRLSYQYRSDWLDTLGGLGVGSGGGDEYRKGYANVDVALRYQFNKYLTLYADLANLTDEKYIAYEGQRSHPTEVEQVGRRFMVGMRFTY